MKHFNSKKDLKLNKRMRSILTISDTGTLINLTALESMVLILMWYLLSLNQTPIHVVPKLLCTSVPKKKFKKGFKKAS